MSAAPKFPRPKVQLIDLSDEAVEKVTAAGYRVARGTLGHPFKMQSSDKYMRVEPNGRLPNFAEQEVVVVQLRAREAADEPPTNPPPLREGSAVWAKLHSGVVDPRPYLAAVVSSNAQRIYEHGGVFVAFCEGRYPSDLVDADGGGDRALYVNHELSWSVWDVLPESDAVGVNLDHGEEVIPKVPDALDILVPHLATATFDCTLDTNHSLESRWIPLAVNKYGAAVAGVIAPDEDDGGWVFLLPQVRDVGACVLALLDDVLPLLAPRMFPEYEKTAWLRADVYELPEVIQLRKKIADVQAEASKREAQLDAAIEEQRNRDGWMHTLLTGTGEELVDAVKQALTELGLRDVRKVDDEEEERKSGRRREDLQIWGKDPVMLVEIKGITHLPRETNSLQVTKYLVPRMREWNRADVRGLAVINQQRGLPPLDRENEHTFQADVLTNAEHQGFGLLTTFDLFRLVRNTQRLGWSTDDVDPLLFQNGRILPIPLHYEHVGGIDEFFENAAVVGIRVTENGFSIGDQLAYALPVDYEEQSVSSIELDNIAVNTARPGDYVGVKTPLMKAQARKGVQVYRVRSAQ